MTLSVRAIFPRAIIDGAVLRSDGVAVGLIGGGAPNMDLMDAPSRAQVGEDFHRILMAQTQPFDCYVLDQPPELKREITQYRRIQATVTHPVQAAAAQDMIDYLTERSRHSLSQGKQVVWAVTVAPSGMRNTHGSTWSHIAGLLGIGQRLTALPETLNVSKRDQQTLAHAVARARELTASLSLLGGSPPANLLSAQDIWETLYREADPVHAQHNPLRGTVEEQVRRELVVEGDMNHVWEMALS